jgi:hypothetical protein
MKTRINLISKENAYQYHFSFMANYAGSFGGVNGNYSDRTLLTPDAWDQENLLAGIKLKEDEKIYKVQTDKNRERGTWYFVKLNTVKGLVYFNAGDPTTEEVKFETRGTKVDYINLRNF